MKAIHASKLSVSFDGGRSFALQEIDLEVSSGELVAVIGLSGAGKSTLLRALNGSRRATSGNLQVLGREVPDLRGRPLRDLRREIGFIFQSFHLLPSLTALQNVLCGRSGYAPWWRVLSGWYSHTDTERALSALASVGLAAREHDEARSLSGGQQQRVAIARALVQEPKMLLADEPMASLDPKLSEVVLQILQRANRERGITTLVNLHVLELAKKYAGRIVALRAGQIVFDGKPEELSAAAVERIYKVNDEG